MASIMCTRESNGFIKAAVVVPANCPLKNWALMAVNEEVCRRMHPSEAQTYDVHLNHNNKSVEFSIEINPHLSGESMLKALVDFERALAFAVHVEGFDMSLMGRTLH